MPTSEEQASPKRSIRFPFVARILLAMALGGVVGSVYGRGVERLGEMGQVIIDLIKGLAGPLLFFAIVDAFLRTHVKARSAGIMVAISLANAAIAVTIGLSLSNVIRPGDHPGVLVAMAGTKASTPASPRGVHSIDVIGELKGYLPKNVVQPFLENSIITIVIMAVLAGWALRRVKNEQDGAGESGYRVVEDAVSTVFRAIQVALSAVIALVPLAVFGVVARAIGNDGFRWVEVLAWYVGVALLGLAIQVLVVYQTWIVFVARMSLRTFWAGARDAVVYALGSSSSLATLPVTLRCLDRMKISPQSARLAACVGTNLNNDGILLYEAMAVLFVAQVYGIPMSFGQQLLAAGACVIAGVGIGGVPDGGLISLPLVLATVGLPVEIVTLLLTIDWLLSRCRAVTNVTSDLLVAILLDRFTTGDPKDISEPDPSGWAIGTDGSPDPGASSAQSRGSTVDLTQPA
jgi:Na+/H+-dicarboxylate symporter